MEMTDAEPTGKQGAIRVLLYNLMLFNVI